MSISKRIKEIRESKGLKQSDMAKIMGLETPNYSRYEKRDKGLTIAQLEQIATALGVSVKELLFDEKDTPTNEAIKDLKHENELLKKDIELLQKDLQISELIRNKYFGKYHILKAFVLRKNIITDEEKEKFSKYGEDAESEFIEALTKFGD